MLRNANICNRPLPLKQMMVSNRSSATGPEAMAKVVSIVVVDAEEDGVITVVAAEAKAAVDAVATTTDVAVESRHPR